jgi:ubiquitin carboxyl-terminal hydrolase L5
VQFEELISLEPEALAQLHPVYGVIFLFKYPTDKPYTSTEKPLDGTFDHEAAEQLFFATQTIQNACGTQALLSVLLNKTDAADNPDGVPPVEIGAGLADFREFAMCVPPALRGEVLSNSELIRETHNSFARASPFVDETTRHPDAEAEDAFHFVAYAALRGTLYELDGLQPAPISHGACAHEQFPRRVMEVLRRRVARYEASEIRFNLLAVVRDLRIRARELGDAELLAREEIKRKDWQFENALRRHNFVSFAGEVLKGVVGMKLQDGDGAYEGWVRDATDKMRKRLEERSDRKAAAKLGAGQDVDMLG